MPLPAFGRALAHRNYRLFLIGQGVSFIGTWMQQVALSWLVYDMTRSAFLLGVVAFAGQIPTFFVAPVAGVLSDRWNRRRTLIVTQIVAMLQALALVALMLVGELEIWHILLLSIVLGLVNAFDMPTRQAFLVDMAPTRADLPNAIALNSSMVNATRLVGPALAGMLVAAGGAVACFVANAASYFASLTALALMRDLPHRVPPAAIPLRHGLAEGFAYAFGFAPIRALLVLLGLVSLMGMPLSTLLPVFANDILRGGPRLFGFLASASGIGALSAGLYLASRPTVLGLGRLIAWATGLFGASMLVFAFSRSVPLSLVTAVAVGFFMMLQLASSNTLLQTIVDDDKRGRVMSIYTMAFMGTAPLGSLMAGGVAHWLSAPAALQISGVSCIVAAVLFARHLPNLREQVRPIYQRAGILPQVAVALETTADLVAPPEEPA
jgi:MFS family permease